jgi:hypothetical protein
MNSFQVKEMRERLEQHDANVHFMIGCFEAKKEMAEKLGNVEAAKEYGEIITMLEHVKDDDSLAKIYRSKEVK